MKETLCSQMPIVSSGSLFCSVHAFWQPISLKAVTMLINVFITREEIIKWQADVSHLIYDGYFLKYNLLIFIKQEETSVHFFQVKHNILVTVTCLIGTAPVRIASGQFWHNSKGSKDPGEQKTWRCLVMVMFGIIL